MTEELFPAHALRRVALDHALNHFLELRAYILQAMTQSLEKGCLIELYWRLRMKPISELRKKSPLEIWIFLSFNRHNKLEEKYAAAVYVDG